MAQVELAASAVEDLRTLIRTHTLPADTTARVVRSLRPLERFPLLDRRYRLAGLTTSVTTLEGQL